MAIFQVFSSNSVPRKLDSSWSWLVCVCATITWASTLGIVFSFGVFLPVFMDYFNSSRQVTACVGSVGIAMTFISGHFSNYLVTRFGCRVTSLIGGSISALSLLVSSFVNNLFLLFFTYSFLFGIGCSCTFSSGMIVINQYFSKRQAIAIGLLNIGIGGGILIMGPTLEALIEASGWRATCRIMAGVAIASHSLAVTFDPNVERNEQTTPEEAAQRERNNGSVGSKIKEVLDLSIWKEPPVIAFIVPSCFLSFGHFVPPIHLIRYCEELGIAAEKGAKLFIILGSCSCVARLLAGFACNHPRVDTFKLYQVGQFAAGLSAILMTIAPTFNTLSACVALYGLGDGLFYTTFSCLVFSVSPQKSAAVLGWQMMTEALFMASGPTLAGLLADKLGSYSVPFRVAGSITLSGAFIPLMLLCYRRPDSSSYMPRNEEDEKLLKDTSLPKGAFYSRTI